MQITIYLANDTEITARFSASVYECPEGGLIVEDLTLDQVTADRELTPLETAEAITIFSTCEAEACEIARDTYREGVAQATIDRYEESKGDDLTY